MLLYNTGSWSAGEVLAKEPITTFLNNNGSWSAGELLQEEMDQHDVI